MLNKNNNLNEIIHQIILKTIILPENPAIKTNDDKGKFSYSN